MRRGVRGALVAGAGAVWLLAGCVDYEHRAIGVGGCFDGTTPPAAGLLASYLRTGGFAGESLRIAVTESGTVTVEQGDAGSAVPCVVTVGSTRAAELSAALAGAGLRDVEAGCYDPDFQATDGYWTSLVWQDGATLRRYSNYLDAGPDELVAGFAAVRAFADREAPACPTGP